MACLVNTVLGNGVFQSSTKTGDPVLHLTLSPIFCLVKLKNKISVL